MAHPLAPVFARAVESLSVALSPGTERMYNIAVRSFLVYLGTGWMARMRTQSPPLATTSGLLLAK